MQPPQDRSAGIRAMAAAMGEGRKRERELAQAPEASQIRAARAILDWSVDEVVKASGLTLTTIGKIERGTLQPSKKTMATLKEAFSAAGVIFIETNDEGPGVRLRNGGLERAS